MRSITIILAGLALALSASAPVRAAAQLPDRVNDDQVKELLNRLDHASTEFRKSLDEALDKSPIDGTHREDRINDFVKAFAKTTEQLHDKFGDHNQATGLVRDVLVSAQDVDRFMHAHPLTSRAQDDWTNVRSILGELGSAYDVSWNWDGDPQVARTSDDQVRGLLSSVERDADRFRKSLDASLDRSSIDGTGSEDEINRYMKDFERATDNWKSHFGDHHTAAADATDVLTRAQVIDRFMGSHTMGDQAEADWTTLRATLDDLARAYNVSWNW